MHMQRLHPQSTALIVVDVQERLAAVMPEEQLRELERAARILLGAAQLLGVRVLATEQYPKGLGPTVPSIEPLLTAAGAKKLEKEDFSACGLPAFRDELSGAGVQSVVILGMEAHICVFQTARDLIASGYEVHVPLDGVASRRDDHREAGLRLCERAGAVRTTSESVVFDWLGTSGSEAFKTISKLVR
jgi:nicotinamidase-related amidase